MRIRVNGTEIAQAWIDEATRKVQNYQNLFEEGSAPAPEELRKRATEVVIEQELISQYLMSPESPYPAPTEKRIQVELRQHPDYYATFQPEEARTKAILFIKKGLLEKEIKAKIPKLTDDKYREIYDRHPENFFLEEGYMVTRIDHYLEKDEKPSASDAMIGLIKLKDEIENSDNPENYWYAAVIQESDSYQRDSHENFHVLIKKKLPEEIAEKLDKAEIGEICGPFFTDLETVTLFRLESKMPRVKLLLEEAKGLIRKTWHQAQRVRLYSELGQKLRENAKIEYLGD